MIPYVWGIAPMPPSTFTLTWRAPVKNYAASVLAPLIILAAGPADAYAQDEESTANVKPRESGGVSRPVRTETPYVAPRTRTERRLAALWSETLGVERVGLSDTFRGLGGHSLSATRLALAIERTFGVRLEPQVLLENRTLRDLSAQVDQQRAR